MIIPHPLTVLQKLKDKLNSNRRELVDSLYLMALQGINKLLPLFVLPYLLAVLGAEGYAYVGFSFALVQFAVLLVDFGFDLSATKHVALVKDDREALTRVFWSVVGAKTLLLLAAVPMVLLPVLLVPSYRPYLSATLCSLPMVIGSAFTFMWMYQGVGRVRHMVVITTLSKLLLRPLIFFFVCSAADSSLAAFLQTSVFMLTAVVSCAWLWRLRLVGRPVFSWQDIRRETADSLPLFLSRASTSVYTQLFVVILALFCTREAVGRYTSAEAIMRAACFILYVPLTQAFFPRISALSVSDRSRGLSTFRQLRTLIFWAMLLVAAAVAASAPILPSLLGASYEGLTTLLLIMSSAPLFIGLGAVYGQMGLVALGNMATRRLFRNAYFIVAPVSLLLLLPCALLWHENGAALALVLTEALVFVLMYSACRRSQVLTDNPAAVCC